MLRITKGLRPWPFISVHDDDNDNSEGITIYTDNNGDDYVRFNMWGTRFYIAAHDYKEGDKEKFTWDDAMKALEDIGMTTFTKKQAEICDRQQYLEEINAKLKEIGGEPLKEADYWTSTECGGKHNDKSVSVYFKTWGGLLNTKKSETYRVRPLLDLTNE